LLFASRGWWVMEIPQMLASPLFGEMNPVTIRMVVDFPAPLGPRNPSTSPCLTVNDRLSTTVFEPKIFVSCLTSIIVIVGGCVRS